MKHLWAPWRMDYILKEKEEGCFFCLHLKRHQDRETLILHRGQKAFVMMNKYPYNNGHLMIVPYRHCKDLESLRPSELMELFKLVQLSLQILKTALSPQGFNIGINIGKAGGAGEDHLHVHIVPRWAGDTNFMPILGETKVVPEYLANTYQKLRSAFLAHLKKGTRQKGGVRK